MKDLRIKTIEEFKPDYAFIGVFLAEENEEFNMQNQDHTLAWVGYIEDIQKNMIEKDSFNVVCTEQIKQFVDINAEKIKHLNTLTSEKNVDSMIGTVVDFIVDHISEMKPS